MIYEVRFQTVDPARHAAVEGWQTKPSHGGCYTAESI